MPVPDSRNMPGPEPPGVSPTKATKRPSPGNRRHLSADGDPSEGWFSLGPETSTVSPTGSLGDGGNDRAAMPATAVTRADYRSAGESPRLRPPCGGADRAPEAFFFGVGFVELLRLRAVGRGSPARSELSRPCPEEGDVLAVRCEGGVLVTGGVEAVVPAVGERARVAAVDAGDEEVRAVVAGAGEGDQAAVGREAGLGLGAPARRSAVAGRVPSGLIEKMLPRSRRAAPSRLLTKTIRLPFGVKVGSSSVVGAGGDLAQAASVDVDDEDVGDALGEDRAIEDHLFRSAENDGLELEVAAGQLLDLAAVGVSSDRGACPGSCPGRDSVEGDRPLGE